MKNILILSVLILIYCSCSDSQEGKIKYDIELKNEIVLLEDLGSPVNIKIDSENRLIYIIQRDGSNLLRVYHLDTFDFVNSFIQRGEGPDEQLLGWTLQLDIKNRLIYSTDPVKKRIFAYSMDSVVVGRSGFRPSSTIDLRNIGVERPLVIDNDLVIDFRKSYHTNENGIAYNLINFEGQLIGSVGEYPEVQTEISDFQQSEAFAGQFSVSQDKKFIVRSFFFSDRLEKLDFDGNILKTFRGPMQFDPQFVTDDLGGGSSRIIPKSGSLIGCLSQSAIGENVIFTLFDGKNFYRDDEDGNVLFHTDIDLNLKKIIYLDQGLYTFDIDWKNMILYGFSLDIEGGLVKYQLK